MTVPDPDSASVDALAERFWESILELNPTTATFYGDDRYADRLEDPGPAGRARSRALMVDTAVEAAAIPTDGMPTEDRITLDMLQVIADLHVEEDDQHLYQLRVVDQMGGPQQLLPQLTQFQPVDSPERLEAFVARLHAYPAFMAALRHPRDDMPPYTVKSITDAQVADIYAFVKTFPAPPDLESIPLLKK